MTDKDVPAGERNEAHAIEEVIDRLAERFPTLERTHVAEIVHDEWHRLDGGRVRDFVPVLVEHEARERLRAKRPAPSTRAEQCRARMSRGSPEVERCPRDGLYLGSIDS